MPIDPISQYRSQDNSLQQIMNGGSNVITSILNQAIQLGRDRVNNQERRDDSLITQDQYQTNLAQRRADNLITQQNNQRNFDYTADQNYRKFALLNEQNTFNQGRTTSQDLFNNNNTTTKLGMAQTAQDASIGNINADNARADKALDLNSTNAAARTAAMAEKNKIIQDSLNVKAAALGQPQPVKPPTANQQSEMDARSFQQGRMKKTDAQKELDRQNAADFSNDKVFPDQMTVAQTRLNEKMAANPTFTKPAQGIALLDPQTQAVINNPNYSQQAVEMAAIQNSPTFADYLKLHGNPDKLTDTEIGIRKRAYDRNKGVVSAPLPDNTPTDSNTEVPNDYKKSVDDLLNKYK